MVARHFPASIGQLPCPASYLAVDVFFVLSGVVLCHAYEPRLREGLSPFRFMMFRLIRIYPLYGLGTILGLVAIIATSGSVTGTELISAALLIPYLGPSDIGLFPLDAPAWTLCLEVLASVVYGMLGWRLSNRRLLQLMTIAAFGLIVWIMKSPSQALDLGWSPQSFSGGVYRLALSFTAGVLLCRATIARRERGGWSLPARFQTPASWAIIALVTLLLAARSAGSFQPAYDLGVVLLGCPTLILVSLHLRPRGWSARVFQTLGTISFPIYAIHRPIMDLVEAGVARMPGFRLEDHPKVDGVAMMVALVVLSWVIDIVFDRPLRAWLSTRASRWTIPASRKARSPEIYVGRDSLR